MPHQSGGPMTKRAVWLVTGCSTRFAVERPIPPHHLLLRNAAFDGAMAKPTELKHDFEVWAAVSRGADFPKDAT